MTACRYYHRPLTDPESVARGVGPVCAELDSRMPSLFEQPRRLRDALTGLVADDGWRGELAAMYESLREES